MPVADTGDHRAEQTGGAAARAQEEALTVGVTALMAPGRTMSGLGLLWGHLPHLDPWGNWAGCMASDQATLGSGAVWCGGS